MGVNRDAPGVLPIRLGLNPALLSALCGCLVEQLSLFSDPWKNFLVCISERGLEDHLEG